MMIVAKTTVITVKIIDVKFMTVGKFCRNFPNRIVLYKADSVNSQYNVD